MTMEASDAELRVALRRWAHSQVNSLVFCLSHLKKLTAQGSWKEGTLLSFCGLVHSDWTHPIWPSSLSYTTNFPRRETSATRKERKVSLTELDRDSWWNDGTMPRKWPNLVPPIIIVVLWPISVPSSTPRQTLPLSCKSPRKKAWRRWSARRKWGWRCYSEGLWTYGNDQVVLRRDCECSWDDEPSFLELQ